MISHQNICDVVVLMSFRGFLKDAFQREGMRGSSARLMRGEITFSQVRGTKGKNSLLLPASHPDVSPLRAGPCLLHLCALCVV